MGVRTRPEKQAARPLPGPHALAVGIGLPDTPSQKAPHAREPTLEKIGHAAHKTFKETQLAPRPGGWRAGQARLDPNQRQPPTSRTRPGQHQLPRGLEACPLPPPLATSHTSSPWASPALEEAASREAVRVLRFGGLTSDSGGCTALADLLAATPRIITRTQLEWLIDNSFSEARGARLQARHNGGLLLVRARPKANPDHSTGLTQWQRGARLNGRGEKARGPRTAEALARRRDRHAARADGSARF